MRKRAFKRLAALLVVAVFAITTFVVAGAADELGGWVGINATISRSTDFAYGGTYSMKVQLPADRPQYPNYGRLDLKPLLTDGHEYEITFWVYQNEVDTAKGLTTTIKLSRAASGDQYINDNTYTNWIDIDQWVKIVRPLDLTDTTDGEIQELFMYFEHMDDNTCFYIDDVVIYDKTEGKEVVRIDFEDAAEPSTPSTPEEFTYDFEDGLQGWTGDTGVTLAHETTFVAKGKGALRADLKPGQKEYNIIGPSDPDKIKNGNTFKCVIYIPDGVDVNGIQIFSQDSTDWTWNSAWTNGETGKWLPMSYTLPAADAKNDNGDTIGDEPFMRFGIQILFHTELDKDISIYIDSEYEEPSEEPGESPSTPPQTGEDEPPVQTGDISTIGFVLLAAASGAVLAFRKRK